MKIHCLWILKISGKNPLTKISKKKARSLGKKSIGYPMDLKIYGKSVA
jgi:hypothetical protein